MQCPICLDVMTTSLDTWETPCGHTFHRRCLQEWLKTRTVCYYCLAPLTLEPTLPSTIILTREGAGYTSFIHLCDFERYIFERQNVRSAERENGAKRAKQTQETANQQPRAPNPLGSQKEKESPSKKSTASKPEEPAEERSRAPNPLGSQKEIASPSKKSTASKPEELAEQRSRSPNSSGSQKEIASPSKKSSASKPEELAEQRSRSPNSSGFYQDFHRYFQQEKAGPSKNSTAFKRRCTCKK